MRLSVADQFFFLLTTLVHLRHFSARHGKASADIFGTEHIVEIRHRIKIPLLQLVVDLCQADDAILLIKVNAPHLHVGWQPFKHGHKSCACQHRDAQVGMLGGKGIQHRHRHGSIAHRAETHDEQPLDHLAVWRTEHGGKGNENRAKNKINPDLT